MMMTRLSTILFLLSVAMSMQGQQVSAQEDQCGNPNTASTISVSNFTSIVVGVYCEGQSCSFLTPEEIHWHIYPLPEGRTPKHSVYPPGLVEPRVRNGVLSYQLQNILEETGYAKGQELQAGVSLYIPKNMMSSIVIDGVGQSVQIHANDEELSSMDMQEAWPIVCVSVDNKVVVSSPYWKVDFTDTGVDNEINMDIASGSSLDFDGVATEASVKCPEGLTLRSTGVDIDVFIEGQLLSASMDGVGTSIDVNFNGTSNPCSNVSNSGVGNDCDATNDLFEMESLSCLADTTAEYQCSSLSTAAKVGVGIGVVLLIAAAIAGCVFCCCRKQNKGIINPEGPMVNVNNTFKGEDETSIIEAEVIDVRNSNDAEAFDEVDLHNAKRVETA